MRTRTLMQCTPLTESTLNKLFRDVNYAIAQPKLNGVRAMWDSVNKQLISSTGRIIESVPHIINALKNLGLTYQQNYDGELYIHGKPFEYINSIVSRQEANISPNHTEVQFHIFDIAGYNLQEVRLDFLTGIFRLSTLPDCCKRVGYCTITKSEWYKKCTEYVQQGYEGIILRHPGEPYTFNKRPSWILKFKPWKYDIYSIVNFIECIDKNGNPTGRVGAIICKDRFNNEFKVSMGKNYNHTMLQNLWNQRYQLINKNLQIQYQELTPNGIPRFGKAVSIDFVDNEEVHDGTC